MTRRVRKSIKVGLLLILLMVLVGILVNLLPQFLYRENKQKSLGRTTSNDRAIQPTESNSLTLIASGDYIIHDLQYMSAYNAQTGTYDFTSYTEHLIDIVSKTDVAVVNFEGTLAQDLFSLGGYPLFNAPNEVLEPLKLAGYNVISTANNHSLDSRLEGVVSTIDALHSYGFETFGTHQEDTQEILIKEVNGIKIAFLSYSYGFNGLEAQYTKEQIYQYLEPMDEAEIEKDLKRAEELADITVVYPHWGYEYHREPNESQQVLAHKMVDWGADLVLGSHPHVIQPSEVVQKDGLNKFIIYSMGNFISNQRFETLQNHYTEQGVMLEFQITQELGEEVIIEAIHVHPTWVNRTMRGSLADYQILPTEKFVNNGELSDLVDAETLRRIEAAHYEIIDHINIPDLH